MWEIALRNPSRIDAPDRVHTTVDQRRERERERERENGVVRDSQECGHSMMVVASTMYPKHSPQMKCSLSAVSGTVDTWYITQLYRSNSIFVIAYL